MAGDGDDAGVDGKGGEVVDDVGGEPEAFAAVSSQQGFVDGYAHDVGGAEEERGGDEGEEEKGGGLFCMAGLVSDVWRMGFRR